MDRKTPKRAKPRRLIAVGLAAGAVISVASLALAFASASGTQQVTSNALDLHLTNAALGSSALARAASAQAIFFAVDRAAGLASQDAAARAMAEATAASDAFALNADRLANVEALTGTSLNEAAATYQAALAQTLAQLESGDTAGALSSHNASVETSFATLERLLAQSQDEIRARIERTEGAAGRLAWLTQALVSLLIPVAALTIYRFMTRRKVQEQRLQFEARLEAEKELNSAKDEFIAGLSHEFRTPLTSIVGFSEFLLEHRDVDPESNLELIGLIHSESSDLSRMVDDLLTAARIESSALSYLPAQLSARTEIEAVIGPWKRQGREFVVDVGNATVWADPLRLRQVLRNLISNAIKHGGPLIGINSWVERGEFVCRVADNGPGVPPHIAGKLFERFVHGGRETLLTGSVGLGLNIARALALDMGGDLVYERIGRVSCFTFRLPLVPAAAEAAELMRVPA